MSDHICPRCGSEDVIEKVFGHICRHCRETIVEAADSSNSLESFMDKVSDQFGTCNWPGDLKLSYF